MHLKINDLLYIQIISADESENNQEYKSRIAEVGEQILSIEIPIHMKTGRLKKMFKGDQLNVYFVSEGGTKNFFMTVVEGFRDDVIRQVLIQKPRPDSISQVQRRNFLRVSTELDVALSLRGELRFLAQTHDVSGGGISFICEGGIPIKDKDKLSSWLLMQYKNGSLEHIQFESEILRIKKLESGRQLVFSQFSEINETERQKIIRYCFERQLELRKS
ncbi:MAG: glycosyl transferase [Paenibacillus sp. RIFOXYA1_FULL_44_5]|nr:MAG: glycosyl transferase [Paenibacillus sp. RIFOXYA1_FULL_44_5]